MLHPVGSSRLMAAGIKNSITRKCYNREEISYLKSTFIEGGGGGGMDPLDGARTDSCSCTTQGRSRCRLHQELIRRQLFLDL
jgi:hypothetical protein